MMTLSDQIKDSFDDIDDLTRDDSSKWILKEDVQHFIRLLKKELNEQQEYKLEESIDSDGVIDRLAGDALCTKDEVKE